MRPRVSVILCAYNEEACIARAIDSILDQTFDDLEIIAVNDGSTDNTLEVLRKYADRRLTVINKANTGLTDSLNVGIRASQGELVARLDADDWADKRRIEIQVQFLDSNPQIALVGTWASIVKPDGCVETCKLPVSSAKIRRFMLRDNPFVHSSVLMRRTVFDEVGWYRSTHGMEDYDLWIRIAARYPTANIAECLVTRYMNHHHFSTRPFYSGLSMYDMYSRRLSCQWYAARTLGTGIIAVPHLFKTLLQLGLCRLGLLT